MASIQRLESLVAKLEAKAAAAAKNSDVSVVVGYTQRYAIFVHENMTAYHKVGGPKFLEQPARTLGPELGMITKNAMLQGKTLSQGLLLAGLRLQRESQQLVPVDTGALKGSAFTRLERG